MRKLPHLLVFAIFLFVGAYLQSAWAQDTARFNRWITTSTTPIRSVSPSDEDYADLAPLKAMVGSNRIVMLGEPTHGDGAAMSAKVRMVKYLHKELGFDMLVFENGIYDLYKANKEIETGTTNVDGALRNSLYTIWSETKEFVPLIEFAEAEKTAGRPFAFGGIDAYHNGIYSAEYLIDDIRAFITSKKLPESVFTDTLLNELDEMLSDLSALPKTPTLLLSPLSVETGKPRLFTNSADSLAYFAHSAKIVDALTTIGNNTSSLSDKNDAAYWKQVIASINTCIMIELDDKYNREAVAQNKRDQQMAENLQFIMKQHPERKIIVWGNNYRFSEKFDALKYKALSGAKPMGVILRQQGIPFYAIAFTAAVGKFGWNNSPTRDLIPPPPGSLEDILLQKNMDYALVNLHADTAKMRFYSSAMYYVPIKGQWSDVFDALIYAKTMTPCTLRERNDAADTKFSPDKSTNVAGMAFDSKTKQPIAYASVSILNTPVGTVTNAKGEFDVKIPFGLSEAFLRVSAIGYETVELNILETIIDDPYTKIALKQVDFTTETQLIVEDGGKLTPTKIMKKAIHRLDNNFLRDAFSMSIFYRGWRRDNSRSTYLMEAALDFFDSKGNKRSDQRALTRERNYRVNQIRRGGFAEWQGRIGEYISDMSRQDIVRSKNNILSLRRLRYYDIQLEDVTKFEGVDVFVLKYKCTKPSFYTTGEQYVDSYQGRMYITAKPEYAVIRNETTIGFAVQTSTTGGNRAKPVQITRDLKFTTHYRKFGDHYFLNYSRQGVDVAYLSGTTRVADEKVIAEMLVTNIEVEKPKVFKGRMSDLDGSKVVYNKEFWDNYTIMLDAIE